MAALNTQVIETDHRLEQTAEKSRETLAQHRWHWTRDETNSGRVSFYAYAKAVGRNQQTIADMVHGYEAYQGAPLGTTTFSDEQARAKMRGDTRTATEAVAEARGVSVEAARRHHAPEVREVKAAAQERAERKGTRVEDEVKPVATGRAKVAKAAQSVKEHKRAAHTIRYLSVEGKIAVAMRSLRAALDETEGVEFSAEERELVSDSLNRLHALLNLLDVRIVGTTDVDWDAEFAKMTGDTP